MTDWASQSMELDPQVLSRRLSSFLRPVPAKQLSRAIGCDVRTAENIRQGHWPIARHWLGLVMTFGEDVTEAVFHPQKAADRLAREVRELEEQLAAKRAALAEGADPGAAKAGRRHEDRAAGLKRRSTD